VPDRVKPSFVIFDIRALWRSGRCYPSWCCHCHVRYTQIFS